MSAVAFPFISADLQKSADSVGASTRELQRAISRGDLRAHYVGSRASKPLILAADLAEWVASLPTVSGREAERA